MNKTEWLIAVLLIGMGLLCMTVSALSFPRNPITQTSGIVKMAGCIVAGGLAVFAAVRIYIRKNKD